MHGKHRHADVHRVHIELGDEHGHRAAAPLVHLAQLAGLPGDVGPLQDSPHKGHKLRRGVVGGGFSPGAGVFGENRTVPQVGAVVLFGNLRPGGVVGGVDVGGKAGGGPQHMAQLLPPGLGQVGDEIHQKVGIQAGDAVAPRLLLIGKDGDGGVGGGFDGDFGHQLGVGAHPVVVAVGPNHPPVQPQILGGEGGDGAKLRRLKVFFGNAVFAGQQAHDVQLGALAHLFVRVQFASQKDVQLLPLDPLGHGLLHLVAPQVGQQIGDAEDRVIRVLADGDGDGGAVPLRHHAVEGKGNGGPLVFLDAAVVVGFEVAQLLLLHQGVGLQVQAGAVDVGGLDAHPLPDIQGADGAGDEGLAPVVEVHLGPGGVLCAGDEGGIPRLLQQLHNSGDRLPLRFGMVQEALIGDAEIFRLRLFLRAQYLRKILGLVEELFPFGFLAHSKILLISRRRLPAGRGRAGYRGPVLPGPFLHTYRYPGRGWNPG